MNAIGSWFAVPLLTIAVAGCARVDARRDFHDVGRAVRERAGARVHWNTGTAEDAAAAAAVSDLLARELDADAAVQVALLNNRNVQATYEQLGIAQADLVRAGLLRNPVFDVEAKFLEGGEGTIVELAVVQSLTELLQMPLRQRLARGALAEAKLRATREVLELAGDVRWAVVDLQAAEQLLELRRTTLSATAAAAALARELYEAGNITALDLANERVAHEQAKLDVAAAEAAVAAGRERLGALMGTWGADAGWRVAARLPDPPADDARPLDTIEPDAVDKSLALAEARQRVIRAGETVGPARRNAILDDVEAGVAAEREPGDEWAVGPALAVPIPLFDQGQSARAIAAGELRAARQRYAALAVETRAAARAAAQRLRSARDRAIYQRSVILPLRQQILDETQKHYNAMQIGAFQLLQARQAQVDAAAAYVDLLREYWLARVEVDQVVNGAARLSEPDAAGDVSVSGNRSAVRGGH